MASVKRKAPKSKLETLRTYADGTRTMRRTDYRVDGSAKTQENFRAGKGSGKNSRTGGAG